MGKRSKGKTKAEGWKEEDMTKASSKGEDLAIVSTARGEKGEGVGVWKEEDMQSRNTKDETTKEEDTKEEVTGRSWIRPGEGEIEDKMTNPEASDGSLLK